MTQGVKRKPAKLRSDVLSGVDAKGAAFEAKVSPLNRVPPPPAYLDKQAGARWKEVAKHLHGLGVLSESYLTALGCYCSAYSQYLQAEATLRKDGLFLKDRRGVACKKHPAVVISQDAMRLMNSYLQEFGLSPSGLAKLGVSLARGARVKNAVGGRVGKVDAKKNQRYFGDE